MLDKLTGRQQVFAVVIAVALLVFIVEMVRRRQLREEYSWVWLTVGVGVLVLVVWFDLLRWLTAVIGAVTPISTFFMFGILFLVVSAIYFSIKVSTLTTQLKNVSQRLAIVDSYVQEMRAGTELSESCHPARSEGSPLGTQAPSRPERDPSVAALPQDDVEARE